MGLCTEGAIIMSKKTIGMAMAMAMAMGLCIEGAIIMSKKTIGNGNGNGNVLHNACLQIRIFWKRPPSPARKGDCFSYNPIRITFLFCVFCRFFFLAVLWCPPLGMAMAMAMGLCIEGAIIWGHLGFISSFLEQDMRSKGSSKLIWGMG